MVEREFFEGIKNDKNIVIYGAKVIAKTLIKRMKYIGIFPKAVVVSDKSKNEMGIEGYLVKNLDEIENIPGCTFIIAVSEKFVDELKDLLTKKGAQNILVFTNELYIEAVNNNTINYDNANIDGQTREILLQYNNHNYDKVERLRTKIKADKKLKVMFLLSTTSQFCSESIYHEMEKSEYFEPVIGLALVWSYGIKDIGNKNFDRDYKELTNKNFSVVKIDSLTAIDDYSPDIIIYHSHYLDIGNSYVNYELINYRYLTCYIAYGMEVVNNPKYHFNDFYINSSWINFVPTDAAYKSNQEYSLTKGINVVSLGYPKIDNYKTSKLKERDPRKIVIISPHWSIRTGINFSTFERYFKLFEELRDTHRELFFVFKPHPSLGYRIKNIEDSNEKPQITYNEYVEYCKRWNEAENSTYLEGTNYIEWFNESTCLITDCGSFIAEYLPSGQPCIYLFNPDLPNQMDSYYEIGQDILNSYYICNSADEIKNTFDEVLNRGNDYKKEQREEVLNRYFKNIGTAGKKIYEYILQQLID